MSKSLWIRIRILGWTLMFLWFIVGEVYLIVHPLSQHWISMMGGLVGALGTFLVLIGYCMLTRNESQS